MKKITAREAATRQAEIMSFYTVEEIRRGDVFQMEMDAHEEAVAQLKAERLDNTDNELRHSIAGGMNDPSEMQLRAFKETLWEDD